MTVAEVLTVNIVLAAPFAGVTVPGLNAQVIPATGAQEKVTPLANPLLGVMVNVKFVA